MLEFRSLGKLILHGSSLQNQGFPLRRRGACVCIELLKQVMMHILISNHLNRHIEKASPIAGT